MNITQEWIKVREGLRGNFADRNLHKRRVDLSRMLQGYPQRYNSYPGEGIPCYDAAALQPHQRDEER